MTEINEGTSRPSVDQPTEIHVGPLVAPAPPRARSAAAEPSAARTQAEERVAVVLPIALAAPALALPIIWFLVSICLALLATIAFRRNPGTGTVSLSVVAGASTVAAGVKRAFSPARLIANALKLLIAAAAVVVLTGAVGAIEWLIGHGSLGWLAAARLKIYSSGPGLFSALLCWAMLCAGPTGHQRWEAAVRRLASASDLRLAGTMIAAGAAVVPFVVVGGTDRWSPWSSFDSASTVLPGQLQEAALNWEHSLVNTEVDKVLKCLANHGHIENWLPGDAVRGPDGAMTLNITRQVRPHQPFASGDLTSLVLALDNQLPQAVTKVRILNVSRRPLVIRRGQTPIAAPVTEITKLVPRSETRENPFSTSVGAITTGLSCSATTA